MRQTMLLPAFAVLGSALILSPEDHRLGPRKSMSFGPTLTQTTFETTSLLRVPAHLKSSAYDFKAIARLAKGYVGLHLGYPEDSIWVREDSYLDKTSGVWYVYVAQFVPDSGLEIANGRIQLSILDGEVLAISDSFYCGPTPGDHWYNTTNSPEAYDRSFYCVGLQDAIKSHPDSASMKTLHFSNCAISTPSPLHLSSDAKDVRIANATDAVLSFLITSHADPTVVQDVIDNISRYQRSVDPDIDEEYPIFRANYLDYSEERWEWKHSIGESYFEPRSLGKRQQRIALERNKEDTTPPIPTNPHLPECTHDWSKEHYEEFSPRHIIPNLRIWDVPGVFEAVRGVLTYLQSPCTAKSECKDGQTSMLSLVWKLQLEMQDNWYEAYVDAFDTARIHSVLDWATEFTPYQDVPVPYESQIHVDPEYDPTTTSKADIMISEEPTLSQKILWTTSDLIPNPMDWLPFQVRLWLWERYNPEPDCGSAPRPKESDLDENGVVKYQYTVWPFGANDPSKGRRVSIESPYDKIASQLGWHAVPEQQDPSGDDSDVGGSIYYWTDEDRQSEYFLPPRMCRHLTTWGNNIQAQENWGGGYFWWGNRRAELQSPQSSSSLENTTSIPAEDKHDVDRVIIQAFYTVNMVHDLLYRYGFDEPAGNFQNHNFGYGGIERDAITANVQDGGRYNNAGFVAPPDGGRGKLRLHMWTSASPSRDSALDASVIVHELSRGLSSRLTGGPAKADCLAHGESAGLGVGWSDFIAGLVVTGGQGDFAMGSWIANRSSGVRTHVYSQSLTINPAVYEPLVTPEYGDVHAIGEVWAEILWVTLHQLVQKHGFSDTLFPPQPVDRKNFVYPNDFYSEPIRQGGASIPRHGNTLMLQLVVDGMKLQPCHPTFVDARDAIILADQILTGGANQCLLWQGFAVRGLGSNAGVNLNGFSVPSHCKA